MNNKDIYKGFKDENSGSNTRSTRSKTIISKDDNSGYGDPLHLLEILYDDYSHNKNAHELYNLIGMQQQTVSGNKKISGSEDLRRLRLEDYTLSRFTTTKKSSYRNY